jgi:hypothetical protein
MLRTAARRSPAIGPWLQWLEQQLAQHRPAQRAPPVQIAATAGI